MLVVLVVAGFKFDLGELRLVVVQQKIINLLRTQLLSFGCRANIDARRFIAATAQEGDGFNKDAASLRSDHALLNLSAFDACKWEKVAAHVVEHFNRVSV